MSLVNIDFPAIINLGILRGACECKCVHCPVGLTEKPLRKKKFGFSEIDLDVFKQFCQEISNNDYKTIVRLHGIGEPTLHSHFHELLQIIYNLNLRDKFWLFTCGIFEKDLIPPLIDSIGIIEFSANSIERNDYLKTKGINGFHSVISNIKEIRKLIKTKHNSNRILVTRVQSDPTIDEKFVSYWKREGFECFVRSHHSYSGILKPHPNNIENSVNENGPKCLVPWRRFNLDGTLLSDHLVAVNCFNVLFQKPTKIEENSRLGKYPEQNLLELWNNISFSKFRKKFMNQEKTNTVCDYCTECLTSKGPRSDGLVYKLDTDC